jgi:hypothetical protein
MILFASVLLGSAGALASGLPRSTPGSSTAASVAAAATAETQGAGVAGSPAPEQNQPGRPTVARMYVLNRTRDEAIPVAIQNSGEPLPVVSAGVTTVALAPSSSIGTHAMHQAWEYRQIAVSGSGASALDALNAAGAEGWEAVGLTSGASATTVLLKRPR